MPLEGSFKLVRFDLLLKQPYGPVIPFQGPSTPHFFFIEHRDPICNAAQYCHTTREWSYRLFHSLCKTIIN